MCWLLSDPSMVLSFEGSTLGSACRPLSVDPLSSTSLTMASDGVGRSLTNHSSQLTDASRSCGVTESSPIGNVRAIIITLFSFILYFDFNLFLCYTLFSTKKFEDV